MKDVEKLIGINNLADCTKNLNGLKSEQGETANEKNGFEIELPPIQLDPIYETPTIETQFWSSLINDYSNSNEYITPTTCSYLTQPLIHSIYTNTNQSENITTQNTSNSNNEKSDCNFLPSHKIIDALDKLSITIQNLKKCLSNKPVNNYN